MAFLAALAGLTGASNARPPSLDPTQRLTLDSLLKSLMPQATGTPTIDPVQQALLFGQNAQNLTAANNATTHALASRGLGRSGILGAALMQNQNQSSVNQGNINLGLQQQAVQQKQLGIQDIASLLNVNNTPGQSTLGAATAGIAPLLAYLMTTGGGFGGAAAGA